MQDPQVGYQTEPWCPGSFLYPVCLATPSQGRIYSSVTKNIIVNIHLQRSFTIRIPCSRVSMLYFNIESNNSTT